MTALSHPRAAAAGPPFAGAGLVQALARWADRFHRWMERRRAVRLVQGLDDHILADIGLPRSDIERMVRFGPSADEIRGRAPQVL